MEIEILGKTPIEEQDAKEVVFDTFKKLVSKIDEGILEIAFVDKERIKNINKKYRDIDKATDVLSFPQYGEGDMPLLGTIFICPTKAKEYDEPIEELIKHGLLHLLGYDHEEDQHKWQAAAQKINHTMG